MPTPQNTQHACSAGDSPRGAKGLRITGQAFDVAHTMVGRSCSSAGILQCPEAGDTMRSVQSCSPTEHAAPGRAGHSSSRAPACALGDLLQFAAGWLGQHSSQPVQQSSIILKAAGMPSHLQCSETGTE